MGSVSQDSQCDTVTAEYKGVKKLGQSVCYNRSMHPCRVAVQDVPVLNWSKIDHVMKFFCFLDGQFL